MGSNYVDVGLVYYITRVSIYRLSLGERKYRNTVLVVYHIHKSKQIVLVSPIICIALNPLSIRLYTTPTTLTRICNLLSNMLFGPNCSAINVDLDLFILQL